MADDAEWVNINKEWGVVEVRPATGGPFSTKRPFWVSSPDNPRNPWPSSTPTPPIQPYPNPNTPWFNPANPHDAPDRVQPPAQPLSPTKQGNTGLIFGLVGGVMGVLMVGLLLYMLVLRKRLSKAQTTKRQQDYSIRVDDIAHLSSPLDDSSQLYVNTSDLHKLVSSAKGVRKHPPPGPGNTEFKGRPMCPVPVELNHQQQLGNTTESEKRVKHSAGNRGLSGLSGKFSAVSENLQKTWRQARAFRGTSQTNNGVDTQMPDIVPEVLDDDDIWSEDSFDSCSIGYEDETGNPSSRQGSTRRSMRHNQLNDSKRRKTSTPIKRLSPPSIPPPPPPSQQQTYETVGGITHTPPSDPSPINHQYSIVRKAPAIPNGVKKGQHISSDVPVHDRRDIQLKTINSSEKPYNGGRSKSGRIQPPLPSLPKPVVTNKAKPMPPSGPKPTAKPQLLPKLKMGLRAPQSTEQTPETAMTGLSMTPGIENKFDRAIKNGSNRNQSYSGISNKCQQKETAEEPEPSNMSVSARRALLEGKVAVVSPTTRY